MPPTPPLTPSFPSPPSLRPLTFRRSSRRVVLSRRQHRARLSCCGRQPVTTPPRSYPALFSPLPPSHLAPARPSLLVSSHVPPSSPPTSPSGRALPRRPPRSRPGHHRPDLGQWRRGPITTRVPPCNGSSSSPSTSSSSSRENRPAGVREGVAAGGGAVPAGALPAEDGPAAAGALPAGWRLFWGGGGRKIPPYYHTCTTIRALPTIIRCRNLCRQARLYPPWSGCLGRFRTRLRGWV